MCILNDTGREAGARPPVVILITNAGVLFLTNKRYTFEELAIAVMWFQPPVKKDTISTLGGRYNESIISHASHQICPFVIAAHVPNIESIGHVQLVRPKLRCLLDTPSFSWRAPHTPRGCEGDYTLLTARVSSTILYFTQTKRVNRKTIIQIDTGTRGAGDTRTACEFQRQHTQ